MRRVALRALPPPDRSSEPGYREWHTAAWGRCQCCGTLGRLVRHPVIFEQHVRAAGGNPWDLRNALALGAWCRCHRAHDAAADRIPVSILDAQAIEFAIELLGAQVADCYLDRYYAPR